MLVEYTHILVTSCNNVIIFRQHVLMKAAHVNTKYSRREDTPTIQPTQWHGVSGSKWRGCNEWLGISTQTGKAKSTWSAKDYHLAKLFNKLFQIESLKEISANRNSLGDGVEIAKLRMRWTMRFGWNAVLVIRIFPLQRECRNTSRQFFE